MINVEQINQAIGAHGLWKARLRGAIDAGKFDIALEAVRADNQCAFGKWLYGTDLSAADKAAVHYQTVQRLHAQFHQAAARVVELALAGKKAEAEKLMGASGEFTSTSMKLTEAMLAWKTSRGG